MRRTEQRRCRGEGGMPCTGVQKMTRGPGADEDLCRKIREHPGLSEAKFWRSRGDRGLPAGQIQVIWRCAPGGGDAGRWRTSRDASADVGAWDSTAKECAPPTRVWLCSRLQRSAVCGQPRRSCLSDVRHEGREAARETGAALWSLAVLKGSEEQDAAAGGDHRV